MAKIKNSGTIINTDYQYSQLISRKIENVVIPSNIDIIGASAFRNSSASEVYIPKNINTIAADAFSGCSRLTKLEFEDNGVVNIGAAAFSDCTALEEIRLPIGLTTLGNQPFRQCSSLKKASISETLASSGNGPFINCTSLAYVFFRGSTIIRVNANAGMFQGCPNIRLFDMRYMDTARDKAVNNDLTANNVYLYINVPDTLYDEFVALTTWSALTLKHFVHSCDVDSFEEIANPQEGHYYSLKNDKNYLNPLGEKQIDIRQYTNGQWVEVDIG